MLFLGRHCFVRGRTSLYGLEKIFSSLNHSLKSNYHILAFLLNAHSPPSLLGAQILIYLQYSLLIDTSLHSGFFKSILYRGISLAVQIIFLYINSILIIMLWGRIFTILWTLSLPEIFCPVFAKPYFDLSIVFIDAEINS